VNERYVVVAGDDVAEGGETLLDSLDSNRGGERVSDVLKLLVGTGVGEKETVSVSYIYEPANTQREDKEEQERSDEPGSNFEQGEKMITNRHRVDR
jgi:hypothetical protein